MNVMVVPLPRDLRPGQLSGRTCAVFDVLRATTTMTAALAAGVDAIRLFADLESARHAACAFAGSKFLCGESGCLPPPGFDLGNSPGQFTPAHRGATVFMCTTNGTRALLAASQADMIFTAALVNAAAVADALRQAGRDVTLLCAGTDGAEAGEDLLGAGAVISELHAESANEHAARALQMFNLRRGDLRNALADTQGGRNVIAAGLDTDIDFAARLSVISVVGVASGDPLTVRRLRQ